MLRNVLGDYLDNITERQFDLPFIALLASMDFYDIHFTHGQVEFGKDFIAKRIEENIEIQYSFQSKAGDINQSAWRNDIMGQILECNLVGLSHPNFNKSLPHQSILLITGKLTGNAALSLQDLNSQLEETYHKCPILLWDREMLIDFLENHGLVGLYTTTASGFVGFGDFHVLYGKSLHGFISEEEIEKHSRQWLNVSIEPNKRLLGAALESEILSQNCIKNGFYYEAIHAHLSVIRTISFEFYNITDLSKTANLVEMYEQAKKNLSMVCIEYISKFEVVWRNSDQNLARLADSSGGIVTYLIHCARILEIAGFTYFLLDNEEAKDEIIDFLCTFISNEPGCTHIPSDKYAISILFPVLALYHNSKEELAYDLIRRSTIWLCDCCEEGFGLAPFGSTSKEEISTLIGYPFEFIGAHQYKDSFFATMILDLSAFLGNMSLYSDVVNDINATGIFPQYWQIPDTRGLFSIEAEDVVSYPNIKFDESFTDYNSYDYAEHIRHESQAFKLTEFIDTLGLLSLALFLRDRYFPTTWSLLVNEIVPQQIL